MHDAYKYARGTHYDPKKNKFLDKFDEPDQNKILHTVDKSNMVFQNAEWHASLRGDRRRKNLSVNQIIKSRNLSKSRWFSFEL